MPTATRPATDLTADEILRIPLDSPNRLFAGTGFEAGAADEQLRRRLAGKWHPDRHLGNPQALEVYQHIAQLAESARTLLTRGHWPGRLSVEALPLRDGRTLRLKYLRAHRFDYGTMFVSHEWVAYAFDEDRSSHYEHALSAIKGLRYISDRMEQEFARYFPKVRDMLESTRGPVLILEKSRDVVLLRDLLAHLGGRMDPRHVAWVMSRLHNIAVYLQHAKLCHHDISLDTCFVSIPHHTVLLLGGWWFSAMEGASLAGRQIPPRTANIRQSALRPRDLDARTAHVLVDQALIRAVGRELLGCTTNAEVLRAPASEVPPALAQWLATPASGKAADDFQGWVKARNAAFGEPKFTKLEVTPEQIYGLDAGA